MAKILTQAALDALKPADRRREIPDAKASGLHFVLQPSGAASWAYRYRYASKTKKLTLGSYPLLGLAAARNRTAKARASLADGVDPAGAKRAAKAAARGAVTADPDLFETIVDSFIERYAKKQTRERTWRETERLLKREVVPAWRGRLIDAIRRPHVVALLDPISDRAPVVANRTLRALHKLFAWTIERGLIETNPCAGVRPPSKETSRERTLDDGELRALWTASEGLGYPTAPLVRMLLLTGARLREVSEMGWSEVDLSARVWTLPRERAKNGVEHQIPLAPQALAILESLPHFERCDYVFTVNARAPAVGFHRWKKQLDALMAAKLPALAPWVLHDLRRSCASHMAGLGVAPHIVEAVLNHRSGTVSGIARVYNRFNYAGEKRVALELWAAHVERIATGAEVENVLEFAGRQ
jgi:integrase